MPGPNYEMRKFVAPEFIFGVGSRHRVGHYARNLSARRVLIVSDPDVIAAGWQAEAQYDLEESGIESVTFDALTPNPKDFEVMQGAAYYEEMKCDLIVAVGGGSVIDCAKGIGIVHANGQHILDFEGIDQINVPGPPLICIPTTAGTAADISQFCIIVNQALRYKISIISKSVVPDVALVDPETTKTLPRQTAAFTGIDAFCHAIEAYTSTASSPIADVHALAAMELVWNNLEEAVLDRNNLNILEQMMLASLHAGLAFSNASLGAVHALAHSLGGYLDLPHGECNSLLLEHVIRFNITASPDRYNRVGKILGLDLRGLNNKKCSEKITGCISELRRKVGIEDGLVSRGVHISDVPELSKYAHKDVCLVTNPRRANIDDIKTIYREAF
jgi:alcohol dehydrogenase class IV